MTRLFVLMSFLCAGTMSAVAQATYSTITINKKMQPGLVLDLPNTAEVAEGTLLQKLKETGYAPETSGAMFWKKNKQDGFYVFNGVTLPALNNQKLDLYFKIEPKGRKAKDQSTMSMLVSKGYDNYVSQESDSVTFLAAAEFLNSFVAGNLSYSLQKEIEAQEKVVVNAEKKLASLEDDEKSLQKKIEQLQADVQNKRTDRDLQMKEISSQKAILDALKAKTVKL
jgi:hypothetical protein